MFSTRHRTEFLWTLTLTFVLDQHDNYAIMLRKGSTCSCRYAESNCDWSGDLRHPKISVNFQARTCFCHGSLNGSQTDSWHNSWRDSWRDSWCDSDLLQAMRTNCPLQQSKASAMPFQNSKHTGLKLHLFKSFK